MRCSGTTIAAQRSHSYSPSDSGCGGAGAYIQGDLIGNFSATVTVYFGATALGSFSISGANNAAQDGSAPFLGILSDSANITSLVLQRAKRFGPSE
jgi:hypothetical protein